MAKAQIIDATGALDGDFIDSASDERPLTIQQPRGRNSDDDDDLVFGDEQYLGILNDMSSVESVVTVRVYMRKQGSNNMASLFSVDPLEFPSLPALQDHLLKEYGSGTYQLRIYGKGKGAKALKQFDVVESESAKMRRQYMVPQQSQGDNGAKHVVQSALTQAEQQQAAMMTMFKQMQELAIKQPKTDIVGIIGAIAPIGAALMGLIPAMLKRPDPLEQMAAMMGIMREMREANGEGGSKEPLGMMDVLGKMVDSMGPALAGAALQQSAKATAAPRPMPQLPPQALPAAAPVPQQPVGDAAVLNAHDPQAQTDIFNKLQVNLALAANGAANGADPLLYADVIIDQLSDDELDELARHLPNPQLLTVLASLEPRIADHQEWFYDLLAGLSARFEEGGEGEDTETDDSTNPDNSAISPVTDDTSNNDANGDPLTLDTHDGGTGNPDDAGAAT